MSVDISAESNLDSIFQEVGEFNFYQLFKYFLLCIPNAVSATYVLSYIFTSNTLDYRCKIPECDLDHANNNRLIQYDQPWLPFAIPSTNSSFENCFRYAPANLSDVDGSIVGIGQCNAQSFDVTKKIECTEFVYRSDEKNLQTEFNIHCEDSYKLAFIGTVNNIGRFLFLPFTGIIADKFGRLTVVIVGTVLSSVFGLIKTFSVNYLMFLISEFLEASSGTCTFAAIYILGLEWVSTRYRVLGSSFLSVSFPIGEIILGIMAMYVRDFRYLLRILYTPGLFMVAYFWLVPESVRWLLVSGRVDRALKILKNTAKANGTQLSERSVERLKLRYAPYLVMKCANEHKESHIEESSMSHSLQTVLKSKKLLIRFLCGCYCWMTCCYCYYGLSLVSTNIRGENRYLSFISVAAVEIPGLLLAIPLLNRFSRRKLSLCTLMITGLTTIATPFIPEDKSYIVLALFMIGKASISCGFSILYIFTAEVWPTSVRNTMMCFSSMVGRIGGMVAPLTPLLSAYFSWLPFALFGGTAIIAGLVILVFPETLNKKLPDTMLEAKHL